MHNANESRVFVVDRTSATYHSNEESKKVLSADHRRKQIQIELRY